MIGEENFLFRKKKALEKLDYAIIEDKVDIGIKPILGLINKNKEYYTSSSCYGRILLLEIPNIGNKKEAKFLGKWHRSIELIELINALKKAKKGQIWLLSQSPIIHIISKNYKSADVLLKIAISCGFKNSGIKSLGQKIVVEICSTERLDAPLGENGIVFCDIDYIRLLINISNEIMEKSANKLNKLKSKFKKDLYTYKTTI